MASKLPLAVTDLQIIATSSLTRPLSAPVLTASAIGTTSAVLSWTAPIPTGISIIAGYRLKRAPVVSGPYTTVFTGLALTFADTFADETWFYTIEAFDQFATGIVSAPLTVQPSTTLPLFTQTTVAAGGETKPGSVIYQPPNALTVACWIQVPSAVTNYPAFVSYGQDTTPFESYILQAQTIDSAHPADFYFLTGTGQTHQLFGVTALVPGTLYFLVGTYDGTTACLYVNGQLERSASDTGALYYPGGGLGLGRKFTDATANFAGTVTNVSIYASALTATQILAQYQAVVGVPTFTPAQPTAAFIGIAGAQTYTDATQQASMGYYDLFVMGGPWEGWSSSGRNKDTIVKAVKAASTALSGTLVFNYQNLNAVDTTTNDAYPTFSAEMTTRNWKLYNSGSSGTLTPANSGASTTYLVNYTTFVPTNPTGEYPYDFGAKYSYYKFLTTTKSDTRFTGLASGLASPTLDGIFQDNFVFNPQVTGDWNRDGAADAPGWPCAATPWLQTGQLKYCTTMRALAPLKFLFANIGDYGVTDAGVMKGVLDGGLCESYFGKTWSWETQSDFPTVLSYYYNVLDSVRNPSLVVLGGSWPDTNTDGTALPRLPTAGGYPPLNTQWQWARYIHGVARLGDGMPAINRFSQAYSGDLAALDRYDEYGGITGLARGWLGKPLTSALGQRPTTARIAKGPVGIYVREYDNGIVAVNPKGNGTQTVTNTDIPGTLKFILGTQDSVRNSGASFSSISLPERDALFLQRFTSTPTSAPILLGLNIVSGSTTGGENNLGGYLSVFLLNAGTAANLGTASGARVFIGGVEVANYRGLQDSVVAARKPGFPAVKRIQVQIGSLAGLTQGVAYPVTVVVNGVTSNTNDVRGNPITFMPNPGRFFFVDTVNGSDTTGAVNDITKPFRYIQKSSGSSTYTGLFALIKPGDTVVIRGNNGTPITDQVGYDGRLCRFHVETGTAPTGASGTGWIHFTAYPGPIKSNACEDVYILTPAGGAGGFMGTDEDHARPNANWGQYWSCSDFRSDCLGSPGQTDASNFNLQNSADNTRFVNLDVQWNSTSTGNAHQKAGGIVGNGHGVRILFCWVHNIAGGDASALENHGLYLDGSNTSAQDVEIGFVIIEKCTTGQGLQCHNGVAADFFKNVYIHHFWVETTGKYGIKFDSWGGTVQVWNGVVNHSQREGLQLDGSGASTADLHFENITFYDCYHDTAGYLAIIANEGAAITGTCKVNNCILAFPAGRTNTTVDFIGDAAGVTPSGNLYYDYAGHLTTKASGDAAGIFANPQFTNAGVIPNTDVTLATGSAALNRAVVATVNPTNDIGMNVRPRAGQSAGSCGAFA